MLKEQETHVKEEFVEHVIIKREDGSHTIDLDTFNRVLWAYEGNKEKYDNEKSKYRLGKVLTIIDGAIADETQRKAIKDMIHDAWYSDHARGIESTQYTHMHDVQVALGIESRSKVVPMVAEHYNPYKELVK